MTHSAVAAVPSVLDTARTLTLPTLRRALATLHPDLARIAGYHCGLTDRDGEPASGKSGKMLRPALVFLAGHTAGASQDGPSGTVVAGAVAVQLVHEFSLLHDDIMDHDRERRGRPTAWTVYGTDAALLTGDVVLALAVSTLAGHPPAGKVLTDAVVHLCAGQADDLTLQTRPACTVATWKRMAAGKTGALLSASCQIGALLAGAEPRVAAVLGRVGAELGLAFQAVDDWLGIWGDPAATGKPVGADIAARKRSLPIVATLAGPGPAARELTAILATPGELTDSDIAAATTVLKRAHADEITRHHARRHTTRALDALTALDLPPGVRQEWHALVGFLASRAT